jgi:hypothetical protein
MPARAFLVMQARLGTQRAQAVGAVYGKTCDGVGIAPVACRQAFVQEAQQPAPAGGLESDAQAQRRLAAADRTQCDQRGSRTRPGFRVADGNLPAVGEAGFQRRAGLTVDHTDFETGLQQIPGGGHAGNTRTENHYVHRGSGGN